MLEVDFPLQIGPGFGPHQKHAKYGLAFYSNYRLIYKLDGVHRLIHSWDRPPVDVHDNSAACSLFMKTEIQVLRKKREEED